ncbi:hypothetical protein [Ferroglobus sp.]|uniref:hypothetical protein n=1 Tax=Ferroglobus sp. TaxID=2614230 RepID=UPI0025BD0D86|nr:hypothetical protein [Ferroglobus sp.]
MIEKIWKDHPWLIDTEKFKRFNQKYTMFSRTGWDEKVKEMARKSVESVVRNIKSGKRSSLLDYSFMSAGWWVAMKGAPFQMDYGDGGLISWKSEISPVFSIASPFWKEKLRVFREEFKSEAEKNPEKFTKVVKKSRSILERISLELLNLTKSGCTRQECLIRGTTSEGSLLKSR